MAKYCRQLEELNVDHCHQVTDKGVRMLAGGNRSNSVQSEASSPYDSLFHYGCRKLQYISLQGCSNVNDQSIWYLMVHCKRMQVLRYHQSYSVAEILCNELKKLESRPLPRLALQTFDHPFPYGLNIPEEEVVKVSRACQDIRVLNLVSLDYCLPFYAHFKNLTKATIEMEDAFGMGLFRFLQEAGGNLREFTVSCGSDPDSTHLEGGGRSFELFNVGLRLAGDFCPNLNLLSISGCGLVTNHLLNTLQQKPDLYKVRTPKLTKLRTLILLTYHDVEDNPIQTCEKDLLYNVLRGTVENVSIKAPDAHFVYFQIVPTWSV